MIFFLWKLYLSVTFSDIPGIGYPIVWDNNSTNIQEHVTRPPSPWEQPLQPQTHLVPLLDPFVNIFSKRFTRNKLPISCWDTENSSFIYHFASWDSHQGHPMANHALEDVEVDGLMMSFCRNGPDVKTKMFPIMPGSLDKYQILK